MCTNKHISYFFLNISIIHVIFCNCMSQIFKVFNICQLFSIYTQRRKAQWHHFRPITRQKKSYKLFLSVCIAIEVMLSMLGVHVFVRKTVPIYLLSCRPRTIEEHWTSWKRESLLSTWNFFWGKCTEKILRERREDTESGVAKYPLFYGSSRMSSPISRLPERSHLGDKISHISLGP